MSSRHRPKVLTGLEILARSRPRWLKGRRIGLLMHPASVTSEFDSARGIAAEIFGKKLTCLFGPQHGYGGEKQDNMVESPHGFDTELMVPVYSLYSETRKPTQAMLEHLDVLLVDLQDVGCRVYTFEWTTALALEACAAAGKEVVLLDRPNPLGGDVVEGNLVRDIYRSFVGLYPVPMRHGLTLGEMAALVNARLGDAARGAKPKPRRDGPGIRCPGACDLTVIPMRGWKRKMLFPDTGLPWVLPSPNMPAFDTAMVYPGQVLLEGTNLSEGRGTTRPFEIFGAPYLDTKRFRTAFESRKLPGVALRDQAFQPTFQKWSGKMCFGFQLHVTDRKTFKPYLTTLAVLQDVLAEHRLDFIWKQPPYEYVTDKLPVDVLTGDPAVRKVLESGSSLAKLEKGWRKEIAAFVREARPFKFYR
jgi:uncharacterized protein YbbC (DUF1343 family)